MPAARAIGLQRPTTYILGLVQTCKSEPLGGDAAHEVVSYLTMHPPAFINLNAILCVVGRVHVGNKRWGIVDRSGDYVRTVFEDSHEAEDAV
jgi:hypothetical protein